MPRVGDHDAERQSLARRSTELFARQGYAGLSMRKAAEALGVSTGTLYHYFQSKEDLFAAVVDAMVDTDVLDAVADLPLDALPRPVRLRAIFRYAYANMARLVRDYRVFIEFTSLESGDPRTQQLVVRSRQRYRDAVARLLDLEDPRRADIVLLALCGLILRSMCGDPGTDLEDVCHALDPLVDPDA